MMSRRTAYSLFIVVSLALGLAIPDFYEWIRGGTQQSRNASFIGQFAIGVAIFGVLACMLLPLLPITNTEEKVSPKNRRSLRFPLKAVFFFTAGVAVCIAGLVSFPLWLCSLLYAIAFIHLAWFAVQTPSYRWPVAALLGCMYLPHVWMLRYDFENSWPMGMLATVGASTILPASFMSGWFGQDPNGVSWLSILISGAELFAGTKFIQIGPRSTIGYLLAVLIVSVLSSVVIHAFVVS